MQQVPLDTHVALDQNLFLVEDVEKGRVGSLSPRQRDALRAVAAWIKRFVARPHKDLGRAGPVCPFVPVALNHKTLWLVAERSTGRSTLEVIEVIREYQGRLLAAQPADDDADHDSIVVVFVDLQASNAKEFFGSVLQQIGLSSYADHGLVMGPFYEGNEGTAIYNPNFRPFTSPVPLLLMRRAVVGDWKFFLNNADFLRLWAARYGESATQTLAEALRHLPWNAKRG
jgi:hypothetical protein